MELELKPDFEETRQRWDRFWRNEDQGRPMLMIRVPRPGVEPPPPVHSYDLPRGDVEKMADGVAAHMEAYEYLGDVMPSYQVSFAADHFALLLGSDLSYAGAMSKGSSTESGWVNPSLDDYDREIRFLRDGKWWEKTVECVRAIRKRAEGRFLVTGTHIQGGMDALAALRDPQRLLLDLIERPDDVKRALEQINRAVDEVRQAQFEEAGLEPYGTPNRHGLFSRTHTEVLQCDFSCMISPDMFAEFEIPCLEHECRMLEGANYHLDGPDAIKHVEAVIGVEKIVAIQWQPGAGRPASMDWTDLYRKIDGLGSGQFRAVRDPETARDFWRLTTSNQIALTVLGVRNRAEAEDLIASFDSIERG